MPRKHEWFEDEQLWQDFFPLMFSERKFDSAPNQIAKALELAKPSGKAALDLCCGPGRCSLALAAEGFQVTGVDRTKFLLDKARSAAEAQGAEVEWIQMDMRDFARPVAFDLVVNMYTSFGYFDDENDDLLVLRNIYDSLKPNGVCFIDVLGKEILARNYRPTYSEALSDGTLVVELATVVDGWSEIRNEWYLIKNGRAKSHTFHYTIYSGRELKERLEQAGFREVQLFGGFDGAEYDQRAHRLIAVARKSSDD